MLVLSYTVRFNDLQMFIPHFIECCISITKISSRSMRIQIFSDTHALAKIY